MKRILISVLVGLSLILTLGATASAAEQAPDSIVVTKGDGADLDGIISPDGTPPPEIIVNGVLVNWH